MGGTTKSPEAIDEILILFALTVWLNSPEPSIYKLPGSWVNHLPNIKKKSTIHENCDHAPPIRLTKGWPLASRFGEVVDSS